MKFRSRLLILLLTTTLIPLLLSFLSQRASIQHFGHKLAGESRALLTETTVTLLSTLVDDFGRILKRDQEIALLALQVQAEAATRRLTDSSSGYTHKVYFSDDYLDAEKAPEDLLISARRQRVDEHGKLTPIPVSYSRQVIFLADGLSPEQSQPELQRISGMTESYRTVNAIQPDLFLWQYTSLENGLHSSYPGKGGYSDQYDPRKRPWYLNAVKTRSVVKELLHDLSTGQLIYTLASPLYDKSGQLLGVTALDIDYGQFFVDWKIPARWASAAQSMILTINPAQPGQAKVLMRQDPDNATGNWRLPVNYESIDLTDPKLTQVRQDMVNGRSAVRKITLQGETALWAYGARSTDTPFPLIIVPYQQILSQGMDAENYVNQQIDTGLMISAVLTIFVVLTTIVLSMSRARKVTDPILELSEAASRLANGDYDVRVNISTADELKRLGEIFNGLGDSLKERRQLKDSLELAQKIQQELLPDKAPVFNGFDLYGTSLYCDETGGDYYDFIPLKSVDNACVGLALGDVSGHGIGAALMMTAARGVLRSLADQNVRDLPPLFNSLNRHLSHDTADENFMTMFYGVLNAPEKTLRWLSAGQAPLFLYRNNQVEELDCCDIPLGILDDSQFSEGAEITFAAGDILLLCTDGVWELNNSNDEMYGTERLKQLLYESADQSAEVITERIIASLAEFRGELAQNDDITLLVVKAV